MTATTPAWPAGLAIAEGRARALRAALAGPDLVMAPGCYDVIGAKLIERAGFPACYLTGSGMSLSALGAPDVGLMSFAEILDRAKRIADGVAIPVVCDIDTGYGGPLNVARTVIEMERAGIAAMQIEDQDWPKKCGHEPGRRICAPEEMEGRIRAAVDARRDAATIIIARTDARSSHGLDAALDRMERYLAAGADIAFVESPESEAEMAAIHARLGPKVPTLANMVEGGRTPLLPAARLQALGFRIAIWPNALTRLVAKTGARLMATLKASGTTEAHWPEMLNHRELWDLFDYPAWTAAESRYKDGRNS